MLFWRGSPILWLYAKRCFTIGGSFSFFLAQSPALDRIIVLLHLLLIIEAVGHDDPRFIDMIAAHIHLPVIADLLSTPDDIPVIDDGPAHLCPFFYHRVSQEHRILHPRAARYAHIP